VIRQFEDHEISICTPEEAGEVQAFIHHHWKENHALAIHSPLLNWQHQDPAGARLHFVVARSAETGSLDAVLGFIPTGQFDGALAPFGDIWLALWKVRDGVGKAGLGLALIRYLSECLNPRFMAVIGMPARVRRLYQHLGFATGSLEQYYQVNQSKRRFALIDQFDGVYTSGCADGGSRQLVPCRELDWLEDVAPETSIPAKSPTYFMNRYVRHPVYRYDLHCLAEEGRRLALLVSRTALYGESRALRIVDYYGPLAALEGSGGAIQAWLASSDAEYVDFYVHGIPAHSLRTAGFRRHSPESSMVVPNYFEPFERRNVELRYAYLTTSSLPVLIFKGDGDQDRPNVVPRRS
jgi:hypothetical protein